MKTAILFKKLLGAMFAVALLAGAQAAAAQDAATVANGKVLFTRLCAACHGADRSDQGRAMLPGTDALRIKYKGQLPALLEQRTDLTPDVIRTFVRRGTWSMPPFRKTEISDAGIDAVSAYIADAARTKR
ncbi:MAG: cytochrome c [Proteobacteria bacterium]|jgi:mono/diheme cytochrome c family protein|nr:cytochrome c [Pseudomonadota bacterium]MBK7115416.1 cytochrome c [Pseudomonadota bacterium]MCC6630555.1 cytochrome c [Gammaproteobacteria bacterium]